MFRRLIYTKGCRGVAFRVTRLHKMHYLLSFNSYELGQNFIVKNLSIMDDQSVQWI